MKFYTEPRSVESVTTTNSKQVRKSPVKMEFFTEPQSQCRICDYGWFKINERP